LIQKFRQKLTAKMMEVDARV